MPDWILGFWPWEREKSNKSLLLKVSLQQCSSQPPLFIIRWLTRPTLIIAKYPCEIFTVNHKQAVPWNYEIPQALSWFTCIRQIASATMEGNVWVANLGKWAQDEPNFILANAQFPKKGLKNNIIQWTNATQYKKNKQNKENRIKHPLNALLRNTMMFFVWNSYSVSMQQLERKLHGCHPDTQSAFGSTTCTVCTTLTYLLEEYELVPEIIPRWNLASVDRR